MSPTISDPTSATAPEDSSTSHSTTTGLPLGRKHDRKATFGDLPAIGSPPQFDDKEKERQYLKERLAAGIRIFAKYGFDHHVAGHLSVRDPVDPSTYWVNPFGKAFALMTVSDLVQVDKNGHVVGGGKEGRRIANKAGFVIHSGIHEARPDVNAICHAHSVYGKAFSALGKNLDMITQDSCIFYKDIAHYADFGGVVIEAEEGKRVAEALGESKSAILQNHGILTTGTTIEAAVARFITLEHECHTQLLADAAAAGTGTQTKKISPEEAEFTHKKTGSEPVMYFKASPYFEVIEAEAGSRYKI